MYRKETMTETLVIENKKVGIEAEEITPNVKLGLLFRSIRESNRISTTVLARNANVRRSLVRSLESGRFRKHYSESTLRIVGALSIWLTSEQRKCIYLLLRCIYEKLEVENVKKPQRKIFPRKRVITKRSVKSF